MQNEQKEFLNQLRFPRSNGRGPIEAVLLSLSLSLYHQFPRSNGRGPIEAHQTTTITANHATFPRSNGRGPIEAKLPADAGNSGPWFPRSNGRGPIEAPDPCFDDPDMWSFRDRMVAAPLKLVKHHRCQDKAFRFPRSNGRGPIEALRSQRSPRVLLLVSAIEWSRPH